LLVIEAIRGEGGFAPGSSLLPGLEGRPDLQIQNTRAMGDGSAIVCDTGLPPSGGGIPGIAAPSFSPASQAVTNALNDFACRFEAFDRGSPCTRSGTEGSTGTLINPAALLQFCDNVAATATFPPGESVLTARLRDVLGNVGPTAQIVVRVATPTPQP